MDLSGDGETEIRIFHLLRLQTKRAARRADMESILYIYLPLTHKSTITNKMASDDIEEARGDTISALPLAPPTRTMQGIEGVLSLRGFNADSGPGPSGGGGGGGKTTAAGASFNDYLAAQRVLKKLKNKRKPVPAPVEPAAKQPSLSLNPALMMAASRLKSKG